MTYQLNQIIQTKKPHACGGNTWKVIRSGAEIGLKCEKCNREIWMLKFELDKRIKKNI
jgi:hypothetical protein